MHMYNAISWNLLCVVMSVSFIAATSTTEEVLLRKRRQFGAPFSRRNLIFSNDNFPQQRLPFQNQPQPSSPQLIFSNRGAASTNKAISVPNSITTTTTTPTPAIVLINNRPTVATLPQFQAPTTASPEFIRCFQSCQTTSEYNPICASNTQLYFNEQKYECARGCGADIQIVRRGSCQGLFPMLRG